MSKGYLKYSSAACRRDKKTEDEELEHAHDIHIRTHTHVRLLE